jgi:tetratricopeptide (TPR) repeat protein
MEMVANALPDQPDYRLQLARYYLDNKQPRKAIDAYSKILAKDDKHFIALRSRGDTYLNIGDHAAAVADFEKALDVKADDSLLLNNFAWVLATSPDDKVRDGARALELAKKACDITKYEAAHILSTLAAAYAEKGNFDEARKWSRQAVELNKAGKDEEITAELAKELSSYQENKPWRERQTEEDRPASDEPERAAEPQNPSQSAKAPAQPLKF